jgi:hypothetical protein
LIVSAKRGKTLAMIRPAISAKMKPPSLVKRSDQPMPNFCSSAGLAAAKLA